MYTAVSRVELKLSLDVVNRDAAVLRLQRKISSVRDEHFVANQPIMIIAPLRPFGMNPPATGVNADVIRELVGFLFCRCSGFKSIANENFVAIPPFYPDSAISPTVNIDRAGGQRDLLDIAMGLEAIVAAPLLTVQRLLSGLLLLSIDYRNEAKDGQNGQDKTIKVLHGLALL